MAGDWIKWLKGLTRKSEVLQIARLLKRDRHEIAGRLMVLWEWADNETEDGHVPGGTAEFVDEHVGVSGFFGALETAGWARSTDQGISLVNWSRHNGESAKKRARDANAAAKCRGKPKAVSKTSASHADETMTREEKRREEIQGISLSTPAPPNADPPHATEPHPDAPIGPGFRRWWSEYPRHRRGSLSEAMRAWQDLYLEPKTEAVMASLNAWKESSQWREGLINRADKWLKEGIWENAPESSNGHRDQNQGNRRPSPEDARRAADRANRVGGGQVGPIPILGKRTAG